MKHRRLIRKQKGQSSPTNMGRRRVLFGMTAMSLVTVADKVHGDTPFPTTIRHAFGVTDVSREPVRVVTLGWGGEDAVIALGKVPIAMTRYPYWQSGIADWNMAAIGASKPVLLGNSLDFELIALLKPDLILAVFSGIDAFAYQRLSRIAPVVAFEKAPWLADWRTQMRLAGRALGRVSAAQNLINSTEEKLDFLRRKYPNLQNKTAALVAHFPMQAGIDVYLDGDTRFDLLKSLGLVTPHTIAGLGRADRGRYSVSIGLERVDIIDADVIVGWFGHGLHAAIKAQPILATVPAIKNGQVVTLESPDEIWSVLSPTAPSILQGYPQLAKRISEVLARTFL